MAKAEPEVEGLGAAGSGHVGGLQLGEALAASHLLDDQTEGGPADALALVAGVDHVAPEADLRILRRRHALRLVLEHDEADRRVVQVDRPVPGLGREQRLRERDRVGRDEAFLALVDRQAGDRDHRLGGDLAQADPSGRLDAHDSRCGRVRPGRSSSQAMALMRQPAGVRMYWVEIIPRAWNGAPLETPDLA